MVQIYVLKLEKNKYYVGRTNNLNFRISQHNDSSGSEWTKKYKPIEILEIVSNCDNFDEDKYTLKYMEKYGINNVRGGSFVQIILSDNNISTITQMINGSCDKCFICGKNDHFAKDCEPENYITPKIEDGPCDCPTSYFSKHRKSKCLLNKIIKFFDNENDNIYKLKETISNNNVNDIDDNILEETTQNNNQHFKCKCYRCGRFGHIKKNCYATTYLNGNAIIQKIE